MEGGSRGSSEVSSKEGPCEGHWWDRRGSIMRGQLKVRRGSSQVSVEAEGESMGGKEVKGVGKGAV